MSDHGPAALASALQRAFAEAGNPSLTTVARAAPGISKQRISDWRTGRHVPSRFEDLEPVIDYLARTAHQRAADDTDGVRAFGSDGLETRERMERVADWPLTRWHQAWTQSSDTSAPAPPDYPASPASVTDPAGQAAADAAHADSPAPPAPGAGPDIDRRPIALAVVGLLVLLVAALAVGAFLLSLATTP